MSLGLSESKWDPDNTWIREQYPDLSAMPRWCTKRNPERKTIGHEIAAVADVLGTPLMPWQRLAADVGMELDPDGKLHYRIIIITIHRQGGKTTLILPWEVHRSVAWSAPQRIVYTAQNRNSSREKLVDEQMETLKASPFGDLGKARLSNGSEAWVWANGSRIGLMSNTKRAGHGFTNDLFVVDEAFAQIDWRIEQALRPTMITRSETQQIVISTAGDESSVYLLEKVRLGRSLVEAGTDDDSRICYIEFSIPEDADIDDPETWQRYLPAVGITISVEDLQTERTNMPDLEFRRAFGNQWTEGMHSVDAVVAPSDWSATADPASELNASSPLCLSLDIDPTQSTASLGVAGTRADGIEHLEAIETDTYPMRETTDDGGKRTREPWVVDRIAEVLGNEPRFNDTVAVDLSTPAGALVPQLEARGIRVQKVSGRDWNAACASWLDAAKEHAFRHLDDPELNLALSSASQKFSGDGWHWTRRGSSPITPLCAVTLAHWALTSRDTSTDYDVLDSFF
ncbi:terminase large subunit domain-containing protein [Curtobacterium oceanosedimentum]|uniref:terminase large subunit domain-containing protein n=1 Tax=Curtobacterium oceanosedimentum TaxID=465820 RepID=UPI00339A2107